MREADLKTYQGRAYQAMRASEDGQDGGCSPTTHLARPGPSSERPIRPDVQTSRTEPPRPLERVQSGLAAQTGDALWRSCSSDSNRDQDTLVACGSKNPVAIRVARVRETVFVLQFRRLVYRAAQPHCAPNSRSTRPGGWSRLPGARQDQAASLELCFPAWTPSRSVPVVRFHEV
jgi:hypothetical protein